VTAVIVVIPAFEPGPSLIDVVRDIRGTRPGLGVVVVDDGSGPGFAEIFAEVATLGATVLGYPDNRGKGYALKAGIAHIVRHHPDADVVCADSDGQHSAVDILRVADQVRAGGAAMVLGVRRFSGDVPLRSRFGNTMTRWLFTLAARRSVSDTQTGLRGYPAAMLGWLLAVDGDRYEYELNLLLQGSAAGLTIDTVDIATIYLDDNESSHFRPLADSVRIYARLLRFSLSSLAAFAIDTVALLVLFAVTGSLLLSVIGARTISSSVNFLTNRRLVFEPGRQRPVGRAAALYFGVVAVLLALNYLLLVTMQSIGVALPAAKVLTEITLFAISYVAQRQWVFRSAVAPSPTPPAAPPPHGGLIGHTGAALSDRTASARTIKHR